MKKSISGQTLACLQMALCASLWSIAGLFIGWIPWNPLVIAGFRSLLAAGVVLVYMAVRRISPVCNGRVLLNGLLMACLFLCFVGANKLTTSANAILLQFTSPVFLMLICGIFLHTRFHTADYVTTAGALAGITLCCLSDLGGGRLVGNVLALLAGLFMAAMLVVVGEVNETEKLSGIFMGQFLTALVGIPVAFFTPTPVTAKAVLSIVVLGVFQLGIPYVLLGIASKNCPPLAMGLLGGIEPILNPVWVALFTGVFPGTLTYIGGAVVIVSVTAQCVCAQWRTQRAMNGKTLN